MSSAFYPQGMNSWNNRLPQGGYVSWKGSGAGSNPLGITSGNIRPFTNNDPANNAVYKPGRPRPLKLYRRGVSVPVLIDDPANPGQKMVSPYSNREVKTSVQDYMVAQMMDQPGRFSVKENSFEGPSDDCARRAPRPRRNSL
jgi:hypothetical protein